LKHTLGSGIARNQTSPVLCIATTAMQGLKDQHLGLINRPRAFRFCGLVQRDQAVFPLHLMICKAFYSGRATTAPQDLP
jgi:hypothetical protein